MHGLQAIEEISEHASREWSIEKALDKMHADWAELTFELAEWKATGMLLSFQSLVPRRIAACSYLTAALPKQQACDRSNG